MICNRCPRKCSPGKDECPGFSSPDPFRYCGKTGSFLFFNVARTMIHHWEEPCISGDKGSGAVFFSGCNLGCVFCQNYDISRGHEPKGIITGSDELEKSIFGMIGEGCHNIDFITGSHLISELLPLMKNIKIKMNDKGLKTPFIWNSSAYETVPQIRQLETFIDVYLPDLKYFNSELSDVLCNAPDYFDFASKAILEMARQKSTNIYDNDEILNEGVMIRHLVLPGFYKDSIKIIEWIDANLSNKTKLSLLSQYVPDFYNKYSSSSNMRNITGYDSLKRKLTTFEYEKVVDRAIALGFNDVYIQEKGSASIDFVPIF
ncbi:MAG: radical SAM protein [Saccharofermentanales bacterium]